MHIKFENVHLHHFLSFDDADIKLNDRGYCLIEGVNKNTLDAAASNGSGKSSIWSAICWALTGETIQGLHSNIPNIYFNDGCWVELTFIVDEHNYKIIRSKDDKDKGTDLKIFIDGQDKSGKGVRDSEALLTQYLPDLTSNLIGSVIILGQGLPHKFADNTPSGRKEVLEKLSKSDFMIEDLKDRVAKRAVKLTTTLREQQDKKLSLAVQENSYNQNLESYKLEAQKYAVEPDYNTLIVADTQAITELDGKLTKLNVDLTSNTEQKSLASKEFETLTLEKMAKTQKISDEHNEVVKDFTNKKYSLTSQMSILNSEIVRLKSIKDVCPTCGQKIPGVLKPDTSTQEQQYQTYQKSLGELQVAINDDQKDYSTAVSELSALYAEKLNKASVNVNSWTIKVSDINSKIVLTSNEKKDYELKKALAEKDKENFVNNKNQVNENINKTIASIANTKNDEATVDGELETTQKHIDVINKMTTLIKRDFRGFLLTNIIDFIDKQAKSYCVKIFNTDDLQFKLNGNNIDIVFCGKCYENLSGGEAQKINIILMLSIRDMMSTCLNFSSNILVLDEITDNLDAVGCEKIINLISNEISSVESLFIISHRADELAIPYDAEIKVEKDSKGVSRIN